MKKKSNILTNILLVIILLAGLSLLLYPSFSDWWNSLHQSRAISSYTEQVSHLSKEDYTAFWEEARAYNETLNSRDNSFILDDSLEDQYEKLLDVAGNGVMAYIEIPKINVHLPVYHGTEEVILQVAIGHLDWTSLPVGGEGTHCVLSGHRGLPSARLFTDLDKMVIGDTFILKVLDEILTYEVDQILVVEPQDTAALQIEQGQDLCTLVTCTPYGINSHRLLIRGHRIANAEEVKVIRVSAEAGRIDPIMVAPVVAMPMLLILTIGLFLPQKKHYHRR
ncbi:MAG: class C sortase [Oscillospiraceae bacterium]|nr:class C sortase [Oscillospiraceae bacterium]